VNKAYLEPDAGVLAWVRDSEIAERLDSSHEIGRQETETGLIWRNVPEPTRARFDARCLELMGRL
jgi:hypothetical protein